MNRAFMILSVMALGATVLSNDAYAKIAFAQVRIQVVDQDGCVVPDAKIWGGFTCGGGMNDYVLVDGFTDTNGLYVAEGRCNEILRFEVRKAIIVQVLRLNSGGRSLIPKSKTVNGSLMARRVRWC